MLRPDIRLENGLYCFRAVVQVLLDEPMPPEDTEKGEEWGDVVGYFRTFGLTAKDLADAMEIVQEDLPAVLADRTEPRYRGRVWSVDLSCVDPAEIDLALLTRDVLERGVHFLSNLALYCEGDEDDDDEYLYLLPDDDSDDS